MNKIILLFLLTVFLWPWCSAQAGDRILFIPHDDRPISYHQTVEVVEAAGYELVLPPKELLSNATNMGHPQELWQWLRENAPKAKSAVIASDSMLYGGLIPSRKHEVSQAEIAERLENFKRLRQDTPNLHIYVFDSLMRTPYQGWAGNIEEPAYYEQYGGAIFQYTSLLDKGETSKLSAAEKRDLQAYEKAIPQEYQKDWFGRRAKNLAATKELMDMTAAGTIDYLILGRDDNAPLCQTHRENREILAYAEKKNLPKSKFQSMPGIDEFNILLLNRAINDMTWNIPFVYVRYGQGKGGDTIPDFSDEKISDSVEAALKIAGGLQVKKPQRADLVLYINTEEKGKTIETLNALPTEADFVPDLKADKNTKAFVQMVEDAVNAGYPVSVADIKYANGADNALMNILEQKNLLFRLKAYSGWNTATNSTGFALGTGMLAGKMTDAAKNHLLTVRYLDDWAYQANVRAHVGTELVRTFGSYEYYYKLEDKLAFAEKRNTELMRDFARKHLPEIPVDFSVKNPWLRMFECDLLFAE
ncbi:MAG: DUF4127 family protein [Selenomonas ruminantium]|uniref:DUF4127 family protein n=2 Tax=Selenomonas ruminantium TaxID=971 RepID=A0A927ZSA0_SELRU|nr:DUF4127 family protein [Selenomonas ruminantium]